MAVHTFQNQESVAALNLASASDRGRVSAVGVRAAVRLADIWQLSAIEIATLLGGLSERTWYRLRKAATGTGAGEGLSQDVLTRISLLVGIYKGLHLIFSDPLADEWLRRPNAHALFAGRTPLDAMMAGGIPTMLATRGYIDALRGGL